SLATRQHHAAELPDRDEGSRTEPGETAAGEPAGIFAFPRGAKAGIFLHEVFERLDFRSPPQALPPLVAELLARHGFEAQWSGAVCSMVRSVLGAPLGAEGLTLARIGLERRFTELEFFFPLAPISSQRLRQVVERFTGASFPVDMAGLFNRLSFTPVRGMLRGFMDLVVERGGRYYILDWKSNHLGNQARDYDAAGMRREMEQNLYPLQYLLYTVALNNYLRLRIPGYDYDKQFGGVFYVFLRGVDGKGNGIFADRPPKAFVEELSEVLLGSSAPTAPAPPSGSFPGKAVQPCLPGL